MIASDIIPLMGLIWVYGTGITFCLGIWTLCKAANWRRRAIAAALMIFAGAWPLYALVALGGYAFESFFWLRNKLTKARG